MKPLDPCLLQRVKACWYPQSPPRAGEQRGQAKAMLEGTLWCCEVPPTLSSHKPLPGRGLSSPRSSGGSQQPPCT